LGEGKEGGKGREEGREGKGKEEGKEREGVASLALRRIDAPAIC